MNRNRFKFLLQRKINFKLITESANEMILERRLMNKAY